MTSEVTSPQPPPALLATETRGFRIRDVHATVVNATPHTNWIFVEVETEEGPTGLGEATLGGHESQVVAHLEMLRPRLVGASAGDIERLELSAPGAPGGLAFAAAASAVEQALWDLLGQELGAPVYRLLGGACRDRVRVYANINRGTQGDRSAAAFARSALAAVGAGFTAVKCAPFDGLFREAWEERGARRCIDDGLARVAAVREAVGDDVDLMVDCHYRMRPRTAARVIAELEAFRPYWVEAPVSEHDLAAWAEVRASTRTRLAGAEQLVGLQAHRWFLDQTGVDVLMPDVKYCGGIGTMKKIAALAEARGVDLAPHNPSGPVSTLASLHVAASTSNALVLEYAWGEVDWRSDLVSGAEQLVDGHLQLPTRPGLGARLNRELVNAHPGRSVRTLLDLRLW